MKKIVPIIVLIIIVGAAVGGRWWVQNHNDEPASTDSSTTTTETTTTSDNTSSTSNNTQQGLTDEEKTQMQSDAKAFYEAAYQKDYDTVESYMTDEFLTTFKNVQSGNSSSDTYGADAVLNLTTYTSVAEPVSVGDPEEIAENSEYSIPLTIEDGYIAQVGFQKNSSGQYKIFSFNLQSSNIGNGGVAGAGDE